VENVAGGLKARNIQGLEERSSIYMGAGDIGFSPIELGTNLDEKKYFHNPTGVFGYMVK
jgi:hypothetical protein